MASRGTWYRCIKSQDREDAHPRRRFVWSSFVLVSSRGSSFVFIKSLDPCIRTSRLLLQHLLKATADPCAIQNVGSPGPTDLSGVTIEPIRLLPQLLTVVEPEPVRLKRAV